MPGAILAALFLFVTLAWQSGHMHGTYRRIPINPPFSMLPGDTIKINGSVIEQRRGTVIVSTRTFVKPGPEYDPGTTPAKRTISEVYFFEEVPMPGISAVLTGASRNGAAISFSFSDSSTIEFNTIADALTNVVYLDTDPQVAKHALILKTLRESPDGANLENQVGSQFTSDFNAATPMVLTVAP